MNTARSKALIEIAIMINSMGDCTIEDIIERLVMMSNDDDVELRNCILLAISEEHSGNREEGERIADSVFHAVKDLIA
jgi:hypothetical protein